MKQTRHSMLTRLKAGTHALLEMALPIGIVLAAIGIATLLIKIIEWLQ